jgi:glucokinase
MTASAPFAASSVVPPPFDAPRLLADVGGTNARFALEVAPGQICHVAVLPCAHYPSLAHALGAYLALPDVAAAGGALMRDAGIAIANPVDGDLVRMTNHHWKFSIAALRAECRLRTLLVVNDFTALARALPLLSNAEKCQIGGGAAREHGALGLIGPGTGLGVSALIASKGGWVALDSEGGHVSFSPADAIEIAILQFALTEFSHVSAERLMSGAGIELIYRALAQRAGVAAEALAAAEIMRRALAAESPLCDQVIDTFCKMLGTVAGNLAVTLGARGGIYIGGGIVPRLGERFARSGFRARFEQKGRFGAYLAQVPTYVVQAQYPAFLGVSAMLSETLARS